MKRTRLWGPFAAVVALAALVAATPVRAEPRVVLVSIDGLRADVALRADMPNLRGLMARGAFTFWATTTPAAVTMPSHVSMLTGCTIEKHGIKANDDEGLKNKTIKVPTLFDLAKAAGVTTGLVSGKSKFGIFAGPVTYAAVPGVGHTYKRVRFGSTIPKLTNEGADDEEVGGQAARMIADQRPRFLFVHFADNDGIGHDKGWGSPAQVEHLRVTDAALGRVLTAVRDCGLEAETTVIVSADHGGQGRNHGEKVEPSKWIPWIIAGPGVLRDFDLSLFRKRQIRTYDSFATACSLLNIPIPLDSDGRPVTQAFENRTELLQDVATTGPATEPTTDSADSPEPKPTAPPVLGRPEDGAGGP